MVTKPGTVTMRKGKWRVFIARKGYRPQWETFNVDWMIHIIRRDFIAPIEDARKAICDEWVRELSFGNYDRILTDMKVIETCMKGKFADIVASWKGLINTLRMTTQVKFVGAKDGD